MQSEINLTNFKIEWFQEYNFDRDHAVFYERGDVASVELSDIKVFIVRTGDEMGIDMDWLFDHNLDIELVSKLHNRPMFFAAVYDGIYYGEDIFKSDSLREILAYTKKYIEAKATI